MGGKSRRTVTVTAEHIDKAVPSVSSKCMLAEAIRSAYPGSTRPHVDMQTMRYTDEKGVRRTMLTPASCQAALVRFDAGDPVEPFAFVMPDPIHVSRATPQIKGSRGKVKRERARGADMRSPARVGGRAVPIMGSATRRRFGIRNLRINQEGQVVQLGVIDTP